MAEDSTKRTVYLYGDLDLHVIEARHLPNMDLTSERLRRCFTVCEPCIKPRSSASSDPELEEDHHHAGDGRNSPADTSELSATDLSGGAPLQFYFRRSSGLIGGKIQELTKMSSSISCGIWKIFS